MVLEKLFSPKLVRHRPYLAFVLGLVFTFVGFGISKIIFNKFISLATVFLATLFLVPTLLHLIKIEERLERRYGLKHFFKNHKDIVEVYIFAFLGVFFAFFVLGMITYGTPTHDQLFDFQIDFIEFQQGLNTDEIKNSVAQGVEPTFDNFTDLLAHNLVIVIICFILAFFYSASAIFLIILNGSVFAHFIVLVIKSVSHNFMQSLQALGIFSLHLIPEIAAFLIAAIAGGIVSKAVLDERHGSERFRNVFKDATILVIIACLLVLLGALIEVFVTTRLFGLVF